MALGRIQLSWHYIPAASTGDFIVAPQLISRYPVPPLADLPDKFSAFVGLSNRMANFMSMRCNDEFYLMGRLPKA